MKAKTSSNKPGTRNGNQSDKIAQTVIFRLKLDEAEDLAERALEIGLGSNLTARDLVLQSLREADSPDNEISRRFEALEKQISVLRSDLSLVTEVLLANAGKVSPAEAGKWVDANLKTKAS